jgi:hypothetical protein
LVPPPPKFDAVKEVLESPELLEAILIRLPMKDLLFAQGVCKLWRELISTESINLRRALFFEPLIFGPVSYIDWRLDDRSFYDNENLDLELGEPLRGPKGDEPPEIYPSHWGRERDDVGKFRMFINPLLAKAFPFLKADGVFWPPEYKTLPRPMRNFTGSWQRMFFTQPPANFLAIESDSNGRRTDWAITTIMSDALSVGCRMPQLLGHLQSLDRAAWIQGRHFWEEYNSVDDLKYCVKFNGPYAEIEYLD